MHEVYHNPSDTPDLTTFLQLLQDPAYQPPAYTPDARTSGGFTAPGYQPAETPAEKPSDSIPSGPHILELAWTEGDSIICASAYGDVQIACDPSYFSTFLSRLGKRRLAVELTNNKDAGYTVDAVYGVEPLFNGKSPEGNPRTMIVQGTVVDYAPAVNVYPVFGYTSFRGTPMPMVEVQIDAADPDSCVWIPSAHTVDITDDSWRSTLPLRGDVVQVRTMPDVTTTRLPDIGVMKMVMPMAGAEALILAQGEERRTNIELRRFQTLDLLETIHNEADPQAIARAVSQYLQSRHQIFHDIEGTSTRRMTRIRISEDEHLAVVRAIEERNLSPEDMPLGYSILTDGGLVGGYVLTDFSTLSNTYEFSNTLIDFDYIPIDTSLLDLTAGEAQTLTEKIIRDSIQSPAHAPKRLDTLLALLAQPAREAAVDYLINAYTESGLFYQVVEGIRYDLLADARVRGTNYQQALIDRTICEHISNSHSLRNFADQSRVRGPHGRNIFNVIMTKIASFVENQDPTSFARQHRITPEEYDLTTETTRAFLKAIDRVQAIDGVQARIGEVLSSAQLERLALARTLLDERSA